AGRTRASGEYPEHFAKRAFDNAARRERPHRSTRGWERLRRRRMIVPRTFREVWLTKDYRSAEGKMQAQQRFGFGLRHSLVGLCAAALAACGGQEGLQDAAEASGGEGSSEAAASASFPLCGALQWWNSAFTYVHVVGGWWDTDLNVRASTQIQLRHPSKLLHEGVYAWGWMPTFLDTKTGLQFRFLHLRP